MAFNMKGFTPFTKTSGKEYRQMRRDKYEAYEDSDKDLNKAHRKERRALRKSNRKEHGLFGAMGEKRSEMNALKARQLAEKHDKRAEYMSELKSDRKTIGGRRHLPWNWSKRPADPAGFGARGGTIGINTPLTQSKKKDKKKKEEREEPTWMGTDEYRNPADIPASEYLARGLDPADYIPGYNKKKKVKIPRKDKKN
jgi:hypothetical protein